MGLGGFPGNHPLSLGMLGMHGTYRANMAVMESDLLIAIGARFDDRVTGKIEAFAPQAKIIHIDIDPTSISKNVRVDLPIVGDCKRVLTKMLSLLEEEDTHSFKEGLEKWHHQIEKWKAVHNMDYQQERYHQTPICHRKDLRADQGRCDHYHRGGPEPDVDGPVLPVHQTENASHLRGTGNHGLRISCSHGSPGGLSEQAGHRHCRGRQLPDEFPGTGHRRPVPIAGQGGHPE